MLIFSLIIGIPALVFLPTLFLGFNPFWDLFYVYRNPFQKPISFPLIKSAFSSFLEGNYHPLTLLSHSLDYTIWRGNPFGHHLSSYLLHLVNVGLVFLTIDYIISRRSRSGLPGIFLAGMTAVIFGIHPLRVESVAWVTERKDVLFVLCYLLTIYFYIISRGQGKSVYYWLALPIYLGAVLSKAMAVSLPAVVLVLDYREFSSPGKRSIRRSFLRAVPFAVLAAGAAFLAVKGQSRASLMAPVTPSILIHNLIQFPGVILFYIGKTLWPFGMSPLYPTELINEMGYVVFAWIILFIMIILFCFYSKRRPELITGLSIFILLLLPVSGLVRVGAQVLADRFSYLSTIPVIFALSALVVTAMQYSRISRRLVMATAIIWIIILGVSTVSYMVLWDEPVALTRIAYDLYPEGRITRLMMLRTYNSTAAGLIESGRYEEAVEELEQAIKIQPDFPDSYRLYGYALERLGRSKEAEEFRNKEKRFSHDLGERYFYQGLYYAEREDYRRAEELFRETLIYNKARLEAYYNLSIIYQKRGDLSAAIAELVKAMTIFPDHPMLRRRLEVLLDIQAGSFTDKIFE